MSSLRLLEPPSPQCSRGVPGSGTICATETGAVFSKTPHLANTQPPTWLNACFFLLPETENRVDYKAWNSADELLSAAALPVLFHCPQHVLTLTAFNSLSIYYVPGA